MLLVVSIDVEEEGLFSNRYDAGNVPASNVPELKLLDPIFKEWGIRPTLMVSYQVVRHPAYQELLLDLEEQWRGEIGAHLHPWNTPPLVTLPFPEPVPSELMPTELLSAKLDTLLDRFRMMGKEPVSFRMGRFNIGSRLLSILHETRIRVDSSVAPMRKSYGGPVHLYGPVDPYFPDPEDPYRPGSSHILEVPITILPLAPNLGFFLERLGDIGPRVQSWVSWIAMNLGSLPAQPAWTGLKRLKAAVRLHKSRGGRVLSVFLHSSELMPGGYPGHPTNEHVRGFLDKLSGFFSWLRKDGDVESLTLSELGERYRRE